MNYAVCAGKGGTLIQDQCELLQEGFTLVRGCKKVYNGLGLGQNLNDAGWLRFGVHRDSRICEAGINHWEEIHGSSKEGCGKVGKFDHFAGWNSRKIFGIWCKY